MLIAIYCNKQYIDIFLSCIVLYCSNRYCNISIYCNIVASLICTKYLPYNHVGSHNHDISVIMTPQNLIFAHP